MNGGGCEDGFDSGREIVNDHRVFVDGNWHAHWTMKNLLQKAKLRSIPLSNVIRHVVAGSRTVIVIVIVIERQRAHEVEGGRAGGGRREEGVA